jgi:hypothetical protein
MVADVLVIVSLVGAVWWWRSRPRQARHARDCQESVSLLAYEDLPPIGAFDPVPEEHALEDYVQGGLRQIDTFLSGRDTNA